MSLAAQSRVPDGCDGPTMHGEACRIPPGNEDEGRNQRTLMDSLDNWIKITYKRSGKKPSAKKPRVWVFGKPQLKKSQSRKSELKSTKSLHT